jgi:lauroyl/myristoyl acyltransferase
VARPSEPGRGELGRIVGALRRRDRAALVRTAHRLGWRYAGRLPQPLVRALLAVVSPVVVRRDGVHLRNLRRNLSVVAGRPATPALLRAGVRSYLRTFWEVLALPSWSRAEAIGRVQAVNEQVVRQAFAGPGAVVALPHSGNWDLAGAWACGTGMPVTTVAEQLPPAEFAAFLDFRRALGMEVLSHRDPGLIGTLVDAARSGRVVCLLADRDLTRSGVEVDFAGRRVTMPVGPALVAQRSGAALIPAVAHYGGQPLRRGARMSLVVGPVVPSQPGPEGLVAMTQGVADFFVRTLREHPEDWHMMQRFFSDPAAAGPG